MACTQLAREKSIKCRTEWSLLSKLAHAVDQWFSKLWYAKAFKVVHE